MGILDFLALPGQERTRLRDEYLGGLLNYYLGPTGIPERLGLVDMMNPVSDVGRAMTSSQEMLAPDRTPMERVGAGATMLTDMAGVAAPMVATRIAGGDATQSMVEGLLGAPMAVEEAGRRVAERLNQPGPVPTMYSNPLGRVPGEGGGLRLWHSSPYDFDRFSMDKIGTGEGAQAYGHGLYFAESPAVSGPRGEYWRNFINQVPISDDLSKALADADDLGYSGPRAARAAILMDPQWRNAYGVPADVADRIERALPSSSPRAYEVSVDANPEDFLDWDAPLSAQSEKVRKGVLSVNAGSDPLLRELLDTSPEGMMLQGMMPNAKGSAAYRTLMERGFEDGATGLNLPAGNPIKPADKWATERLRAQGIPGIRYLDAGSRSAGDGSRNYVVFDENLISIIRKYGIAGAAAMLGMSQADLAQAMEQQQQPQGLLGGPR